MTTKNFDNPNYSKKNTSESAKVSEYKFTQYSALQTAGLSSEEETLLKQKIDELNKSGGVPQEIVTALNLQVDAVDAGVPTRQYLEKVLTSLEIRDGNRLEVVAEKALDEVLNAPAYEDGFYDLEQLREVIKTGASFNADEQPVAMLDANDLELESVKLIKQVEIDGTIRPVEFTIQDLNTGLLELVDVQMVELR